MHPRIITTRPLAIFEAIERFQITHAYMTNSISARLVKEAANGSQVLSSLKMAWRRDIPPAGSTETRSLRSPR
jgi:hypothetical protein